MEKSLHRNVAIRGILMVAMKGSEMLSSTPPFTGSGADSETRTILVLYVDDCPDLANLISRFLETDGEMMVDTSLSVEEAINTLRYISYDVIVTDYNSKAKRGNDLLRNIRAQGGKIPFVYFVLFRESMYEAEAKKLGQVSFVEKIGKSGSNFFNLRKAILEAVGSDKNSLAVPAKQLAETPAGATKA